MEVEWTVGEAHPLTRCSVSNKQQFLQIFSFWMVDNTFNQTNWDMRWHEWRVPFAKRGGVYEFLFWKLDGK